MRSKFTLVAAVLGTLLLCSAPRAAQADGCAPGQPCWEKKMKKAPPPAPGKSAPAPVAVPPPAPAKSEMMKEEGSGLSLGLGVDTLFFNCEDTHVAPALRVNYMVPEMPLNLMVGVEGTHIHNSDQFRYSEEDNHDVNWVRVPFRAEFVLPVSDETTTFFGGGPDIIHIDGFDNDTDVGGHLSARVSQALTEDLSLSVDTGYLWANLEQKGKKYDSDSAFIGTFLDVKF